MKILEVEKLTHEKWLNLFATRFEHNGKEGRWVFASRQPLPYHAAAVADAVIIVPILTVPGQPNRLVMIREFRVPVASYTYGLPAGLLEPGETIEDTVRRELLEETALEVTRVKRVTQGLYSSTGMTDEAAAMAFVDARPVAGLRPRLDASEDIEAVFLDYRQVCLLCEDRSVRLDAKAWMALYMYQQLGCLV